MADIFSFTRHSPFLVTHLDPSRLVPEGFRNLKPEVGDLGCGAQVTER